MKTEWIIMNGSRQLVVNISGVNVVTGWILVNLAELFSPEARHDCPLSHAHKPSQSV